MKQDALRYEGPIYRPPSEAKSLLIQATIGCPHNRCTFCMVYKKAPPFRVRKLASIKADINKAQNIYGNQIETLFLPAGNTIAMQTEALAEICRFAHQVFPRLRRITVYGSSQYIYKKGLTGLKVLAAAGLARIHVGLESGDEEILTSIKKGSTRRQQMTACRWVREAGIQLSVYVMLGIGGRKQSQRHATETAQVLNRIKPDFIRLRTFVPKIDTDLLTEVKSGIFQMLGPHATLNETAMLLKHITTSSYLTSDHYTNYINLEGELPGETPRLLAQIEAALKRPEDTFRPFFIGTE